MPNKRRNIDFHKLVAPGESEYDFCAQTANGSARTSGTGWNRRDQQYNRPQDEPGGPWQPGYHNNRTGE